MKLAPRKLARCAIYTRKSTEHNLDLEFNSLDAQRESCEAYIKSQAHESWRLVPDRYDDGGLSGASLERPALQALLADGFQYQDRFYKSLSAIARQITGTPWNGYDFFRQSLQDSAGGNQ